MLDVILFGRHTFSMSNFVAVEESSEGRLWTVREIDQPLADRISRLFDIPPVLAEVLVSRGFDLETVDNYLDPKIKNLMPDPSIIKDLDKAVDRLIEAIEKNEKITVFGDYDVDGATSSALLRNYFREIGHDIDIYIPHRINEGYGPQIDAFKKLKKEKNTDLIITVDCGASAHSVIQEANGLGLSTIVFDHHQGFGELPPADAVVNPNHESDNSGLNYLAGCGVTFMVLVALNRKLKKKGFFKQENIKEPNLMMYLDLVALGTVADVMPLEKLNRAFVKQGLIVMNQRENKGLKFLMNAAGLVEKITSYSIGFVLGPRINAGGRLGDQPHLGASLLSTTSDNEASYIANELDGLNIQRRQEQEDALKVIYKNDLHITDDPFVMLADEEWHQGIIGIMAGRIKEECFKPSAIMTYDEKTGLWKGSARSVEGIDLGKIIHAAKEEGLLEKAGGHKMAAGFSIKEEKIEEFRAFMNKSIIDQLNGEKLVEQIDITSVVSLSSVNLNFAEKLKIMEPCGQGNPRPSFLLTSVRVKQIKIQKDKGDSDFLIVVLSDDTGQGHVEAKVFVKKDSPLHKDLLDPSRPVLHLAGEISVNEFQGRKKVQFDIKDCVRDYVDLPFKKKRSMTKQKKNSSRKRATKTPVKRGPKPR